MMTSSSGGGLGVVSDRLAGAADQKGRAIGHAGRHQLPAGLGDLLLGLLAAESVDALVADEFDTAQGTAAGH